MIDKIIRLSSDSFEKDVLQSKGLLLVDFWAEWCGPCKMITPILMEIADEFSDKLAIAKLNIEDHPDIAQKYGIRSIPTLLLFCDGKVVATKIGSLSKGQLKEFLNANM